MMKALKRFARWYFEHAAVNQAWLVTGSTPVVYE